MSKTFITADLHFSHKNIMKFCPETRGQFHDIDHMNSEMIRMWNEEVSPEDLVYILGDVAFCSAVTAVSILNRLNGNKILIVGNHDIKLLQNSGFRSCFKEVHQYLRLSHNGHIVIMFHYPIFDHDQAGRGSIMLHGHRHGAPHNIQGKIMDVGFDSTGKIVTLLDDILDKMKDIPSMTHH